ncbi:MAG TPA: saccharopine dehydrogenase NADP-binding domain-containing protein [Archangium sp.]|uniref:saccharopine dehydrogenase family protein n=1 Tax=Archangium sp. TaxID=1872627 RepID=UPI002E378E69|nr:saccharopine dehydrogenase NADP-binding domain-containing protein [Archangium sp.]HEX5748270.1 saccharopine dehydrogenase NADP-binding domain-containing protein [Archangium sp.]
MKTDTLLILGGYGNTGQSIARLLLKETDCHVVLAGRDLARAEAMARALASKHGSERVSAVRADAADPSSLRQAMEGCRLAVVASSTPAYAGQVARAALDTGTDYLDVQVSTAKLGALSALEEDIRRAGRCFITDGGFHPGLPAVLVRYAGSRFEHLTRAEVGSVIRVEWARLDIGATAIEELVGLAGSQILEFQKGTWRPARWTAMWTPRTMDFGPVFGRQYCVPMFLEEMRSLPELYPGLRRVGFYVGGLNWFVDWVVFPLAWLAMRVWPRRALRPMARLMHWGLCRFSRPPYGTLLKLEADGLVRGTARHLELTLSHADAYELTAIPVVACLLQYLDGTARRPGLWLQAHVAEPERMLRDMERMGVAISLVEPVPGRERTAEEHWAQTPAHSVTPSGPA